MPTPTYDLISSTTLGSATTSVSFSNIPSTYRDLVLVVAGTIPSGFAPDIEVLYNSDTTTANYSTVKMYGDGTTAYSGTFTPKVVGLAEGTSSAIIQIMDYATTNKHKTILSRTNTNGSSWGVAAAATRWANTSAITSLTINAGGSTASSFQAGAVYSLYGIVS